MTDKKLSTKVCVGFSLPGFTENMMMAPVLGILPALYAEDLGLSLASIGLMFMVARIFDAATDPMVGYLSDRTQSRFGARKPWIVAGQALSLTAIYFLFIPRAGAGTLYFALLSSLHFLGWTMLMIPYNAWTTELTGDYGQRARLFTYRSCAVYIGALLFTVSPLVLSPWTGSTEYSFEFMKLLCYFLLVAIPILTIIALRVVPQGNKVTTDTPSLRDSLQAIKSNKVLLLFMLLTVIASLAQGVVGALEFLYLSNFMKLGPYVPILLGTGVVTSLLAIPIWYSFVQRFGKHKPWAVASFVFAICTPLYFLLEPGEGALPWLFLLTIILGFVRATGAVAPQSMLADIVDFDTLKTGANRAGSFFSLLMLISKGGLAIGGGVGLWLVGIGGYDPSAVTNDPSAQVNFILVYAILPGIMLFVTGLLALKYPLDERKQAVIRKRIEQLAERAHAKDVVA